MYKYSSRLKQIAQVIHKIQNCSFWISLVIFQVVTAPMSTINAIAVEAYKKYILVSLIHHGQVSVLFLSCLLFDMAWWGAEVAISLLIWRISIKLAFLLLDTKEKVMNRLSISDLLEGWHLNCGLILHVRNFIIIITMSFSQLTCYIYGCSYLQAFQSIPLP